MPHRHEDRGSDGDEGHGDIDLELARLNDARAEDGKAHEPADRLVETLVRPPADHVEGGGDQVSRPLEDAEDQDGETDREHRQIEGRAGLRHGGDLDADRMSGDGAGHRARHHRVGEMGKKCRQQA